MIRKYKIVLRTTEEDVQDSNSELELFNGQYLVNEISNAGMNKIVTKNTVMNYLSNPNNVDVVSGFTQYLKSNSTNQETFDAIYYDVNRVTPILNDYYRSNFVFNSSPKTSLINTVLSGGSIVYSENNNHNLETNQRFESQEKKIITTSQKDSYYIDVYIPRTNNDVQSGDYSKYVEECVEDGVVLKNCFVNLNPKDDPFEFWSNDIKIGDVVEIESDFAQRLNLSAITNV